MKISIESYHLPGTTTPRTTMTVNATVEEIKAAHKAMIDAGYPKECTPMAIVAQVCMAGRNAAQKAMEPV